MCFIWHLFFSSTGNEIHPDSIWTEVWGDGKNLGLRKCDDGGLENGDGCNSNCEVENGFEWSGGSFVHADACIEICKKFNKAIFFWFGKILFYLKYFLENSINDFLFILAIRSIAQPELLLIDSQGTLMIKILIQSQT